jgi:hypothetical protein
MSIKDRAKISYLDEAGTYYYVSSVAGCHDNVDANAYLTWLADKNRMALQVGIVVVEPAPYPPDLWDSDGPSFGLLKDDWLLDAYEEQEKSRERR